MAVWIETSAEKREIAVSVIKYLPPFSPTLIRLIATLAKENVFLTEIAAIIETDTVLAGQVLKLVNSALYARSGAVNSIPHAVAILGIAKLRNLALSLSVIKMWKAARTPKTWSQAEFNRHAIATAIMADVLAQKLDVFYSEGAFAAGLFHGMGKLLIAAALPQHRDTILKIAETEVVMSREQIEQSVLGFTHCELAAETLHVWKLPGEIQQAVRNQHGSQQGRSRELPLNRLVHIAHHAVNKLDLSIPDCQVQNPPAIELVLAPVGLSQQWESIQQEFETEYGTFSAYF